MKFFRRVFAPSSLQAISRGESPITAVPDTSRKTSGLLRVLDVQGGEDVDVTIELDLELLTVEIPEDLKIVLSEAAARPI